MVFCRDDDTFCRLIGFLAYFFAPFYFSSHEAKTWVHLPQIDLSIDLSTFQRFELTSLGGELGSWRRRRRPRRRRVSRDSRDHPRGFGDEPLFVLLFPFRPYLPFPLLFFFGKVTFTPPTSTYAYAHDSTADLEFWLKGEKSLHTNANTSQWHTTIRFLKLNCWLD